MSYIGFVFGHVRAIKWAKALGENELANKLRAEIMKIYAEDRLTVNALTLAIAAIMGDAEQVSIMRDILDNRKK